MKSILLFLTLFFFFSDRIAAQCDILEDSDLILSANQILSANMECTDSDGWTHYFNSSENKLLLSINKNGQDIGAIGLGLMVRSGTLSGWGNGAYNLSNADYIANDIWVVANRYWQILGANEIASPVQIRFYFSEEDMSDLAESVDDFGFVVDEPDDLLSYTLGNANGISPYAETTQPYSAIFTLYDTGPGPAPDWTSGTLNDFYFSEFQTTDLDNAGSLGFLIFQADPPVSVSGNITRSNGVPVSGVSVEAASTSIDVTGTDGSFICPTLIPGGNYEIVPLKNTNPTEGVSVEDLISLARHLLNLELLTSPYEIIAADADDDATISFNDLNEIRKLVLGKTPNLINSSWRFVPEDYAFTFPNDPFLPPFPEWIELSNLPGELNGQDFIGVKIGDLTTESTSSPPAFNPSFSLPVLSTCNPGDEIVFPLIVSDFQNIRGFQFTLDWNAEIMEYIEVTNLQLPGFTQQSIGDVSTDEGKLAMVWFNPADLGSSLNDGDAICEIRFVVTGDFGEQTSLNFTSSIAKVALLHQDLSPDDPTFTTGGILIENNSLLETEIEVVHASCDGQANGSIDLTVANAIPPLNFLWSNGMTTEDINNLMGGEYRVTVSDNSGNCPKVFFATVAPTGPIGFEALVKNLSCPFGSDGSIELLTAGGPFTYNWSTGENSSTIQNLTTGIYEVTISDLAGCTATGSFEIDNPNQIQPSTNIVNATDENSMDGAVTLVSIGGGTPPFTFLWSTGDTTQSIENLSTGEYTVSISDGLGCLHVFDYFVGDVMTATNDASFLSSFMLSPNPVLAGAPFFLHFKSEVDTEVSFRLFTSSGVLIEENKISIRSGLTEYELSAPPFSGSYFLEILTADGTQGWAKFVTH